MESSQRSEPSEELTAVTDAPVAHDLTDPDAPDAYVLLERIGVGGMGQVYRAFDSRLDREVALKFLRPEVATASERGRLLKEAQSMARLNHPNIVPVYDVHAAHGRVCLAMEYIRGESLRSWMRRAHPWREVVEVFLRAGTGLAAAHECGIVHRDFKPDNVMVGDDGRVRVVDFGIARATGDAPDPSADLLESSASMAVSVVTAKTATGTVMGTSAYMAPEQHLGRPIDARSDVYAFCVSLYEALAGRKPFQAASLQELVKTKSQTAIRPIARSRRVPAELARIVYRGLAYDPVRRWPSMAAVLRPLELLRGRRRRSGIIVSVVGLGGTLVAVGALADSDAESVGGCSDPGTALGSWGENRRGALSQSFQGSGVSFAGTTWPRVKRSIDAWADAWQTAYAEACQRSPSPVGDRSMQCLRAAEAELDATLDVLADEPDLNVVEGAVEAVVALPSPAECSDLGAHPAIRQPPEARAELARLRGELARARALARFSYLDEAEGLLRRAGAQVEALRDPTLESEFWLLSGDVAQDVGDIERARTELEAAYFSALAVGEDRLALTAAKTLVNLMSEGFGDYVKADHWLAAAAAIVPRLDDPEAAPVQLLVERAALRLRMGEPDDAWADVSEALRLIDADSTPDAAASALNLASMVALQRGEFEEARRMSEQLLEMQVETFGEGHPRTGIAFDLLGRATYGLGEYEQALGHHRRALELRRKDSYGDLAISATNVGIALSELGRYEETRKEFQYALEQTQRAFGRNHPRYGISLNNLGAALEDLERYEESRDVHLEALALWEATVGSDHPHFATTEYNLGRIERAMSRYDEALEHFARALTIRERRLGAEHPETATVWHRIGSTLMAAGRNAEAVRPLERALEIRRSALGEDHPRTAEARADLDRAR